MGLLEGFKVHPVHEKRHLTIRHLQGRLAIAISDLDWGPFRRTPATPAGSSSPPRAPERPAMRGAVAASTLTVPD
jgi:hypothetical protein